METTHQEFQTHYRYISHVIDFLTAFNDNRRNLEQASQHSITELVRIFNMLKDTFDYFESLRNSVHTYPTDPDEGPENPETNWPMAEENVPNDSVIP